MSAKKTSSALMTSMILHGVAVLILGVYLVTQTPQFKDLVSAEILNPADPPKLKPRIPPRRVVRPATPTDNTVFVAQVQVQPRVTTAAVVRTATFEPQTALEFSNKFVRLNQPIDPNVPKFVNPNVPVPRAMTHADLPVSDAPGVLAFSGPVASAPSAGTSAIGRGIAPGTVQAPFGPQRPPGLAMVEHVGATRDALEDVVESITLGNDDVPPLPRGEPGGTVIGKGRDIRGVFRFTRIRHNLSDWWADASSLNALTKWLNERTHIKTDMNVEGGAVKLTDAALQKTPLAFFTGHDPALARSRGLAQKGGYGSTLNSRLTEPEAVGLRRYLVERGGLLVFDDCGVNAADRGFTRVFLAQMRYVMPEHQVGRIPNDHELYNNFYEMGGPPVGFDIFWFGTKPPPRRNFLEGISIGEKLSVLVVRRDYMCAMEAQ
ncbi:MAG: DUF4159 domain-containing protein [Candidatus Poribacteria bacterium]|nr:DUF4159 domain-containing protein [Candidatus Poribacteria bacterium]